MEQCGVFLALPGFRVLGIDGRSGAGKTRFADVISKRTAMPHSTLHLDDVYPGWEGLDAGIRIAQDLVAQLSEGQSATYTPYRWPGMQKPKPRTLSPLFPLIIEGVGATLVLTQLNVNLTVWLTAPQRVRKSRALARDGATYEPFWNLWEKQESALFSALYPHSSLYVDAYEI